MANYNTVNQEKAAISLTKQAYKDMTEKAMKDGQPFKQVGSTNYYIVDATKCDIVVRGGKR